MPLIAASDKQKIRIWDSETIKHVHTLRGHTNLVISMSFNKDNTKLVSGSYDNTIRIWDSESGECLNTILGNVKFIINVSFSSDDRIISTICNGDIKILNLETFEIIDFLSGQVDDFRSACFSNKEGNYI